jgi:hypothetical protein
LVRLLIALYALVLPPGVFHALSTALAIVRSMIPSAAAYKSSLRNLSITAVSSPEDILRLPTALLAAFYNPK